MEIQNVSLIGLGALGTMFGSQLTRSLSKENFRVVADRKRVDRYQKEGVFCNGVLCNFQYVTPDEPVTPADLVLIGVKFNDLEEAIQLIKGHVGANTLIISMLNGISSERVLAKAFGEQKIIYCVAQGMDAVKVGNQISYANMGVLCIGDWFAETPSANVQRVVHFFQQHQFPYMLDSDMKHRLWGKFMLNVGVNQTVAVFETNYEGIQREGEAREMMFGAMREVMKLSEYEDVGLTEADIEYWVNIVDGLNPEGKPSLRQDLEAGRRSEVELFAGTVKALGRNHGLATPINDFLYEQIMSIEADFAP